METVDEAFLRAARGIETFSSRGGAGLAATSLPGHWLCGLSVGSGKTTRITPENGALQRWDKSWMLLINSN